MLELHLLNMYRHQSFLIVTFHDDTEIGLVIKIRGTEDVIHPHTGRDTRQRIAVHLARMGYKDDQAMVVRGKAAQTVQQ